MQTLKRLHDETIEENLMACVGSLRKTGDATWSFHLSNGSGVEVSAEAAGEWLTFAGRIETPAKPRTGKTSVHWRLLELNTSLRGGVKILPDADGRLRFCADVPLDSAETVAMRIPQVLGGLRQGASRLARRSKHTQRKDMPSVVGGEAEPPGVNLGDLCATAGWAFVEHADARLAVSLETGRATPLRAIVERSHTEGVRAGLELLSGSKWPPVCREALGRMLGSVAASVRMVRGTRRRQGDTEKLELEVSFDSAPTAEELHHALSALSVAGGMCAEEVKMLTDEDLAAAWLEARSTKA